MNWIQRMMKKVYDTFSEKKVEDKSQDTEFPIFYDPQHQPDDFQQVELGKNVVIQEKPKDKKKSKKKKTNKKKKAEKNISETEENT